MSHGLLTLPVRALLDKTLFLFEVLFSGFCVYFCGYLPHPIRELCRQTDVTQDLSSKVFLVVGPLVGRNKSCFFSKGGRGWESKRQAKVKLFEEFLDWKCRL